MSGRGKGGKVKGKSKSRTWEQSDRLKCLHCTKTYVRREQLDRHTLRHEGPAPPPPKESKKKPPAEGTNFCKEPNCTKKRTGFVHKRDLETHWKRNHDPTYRKPICSGCSKSFASPSSLKRHERGDSCGGGRYKK